MAWMTSGLCGATGRYDALLFDDVCDDDARFYVKYDVLVGQCGCGF